MIGPLIPIPKGRKGPILKDWQNLTPEQLAAEFKGGNGFNVGVRLDNYAVLDPDTKDAGSLLESWEEEGKLPPTVAWRTAAGNIKRLYQRPPELQGCLTIPEIKLQLRTGAGMQDVIPPSYVKDPEKGIDGVYAWQPDQDPESITPAPLPQFVLEYFKENSHRQAQGGRHDFQGGIGAGHGREYEAYGQKALADELAKLARARKGERNITLNQSAFSLGQLVGARVLDRGTVEAALNGVALSIGLGEAEAQATIKSGLEAGMKEPRELPEREGAKNKEGGQDTDQKKQEQTQKAPKPFVFKTITAKALAAKDFPPRRWAIPRLITEGLTILAGPPKVCKSWLALNVALAVAGGGMVLGKIPVEQGEVLYLALEDSERRLKERLKKITPVGEPPEALSIATAGDFPALDKGGLVALAEWLKKHPRAKLVIIDTLARVKPGRSRNQDSYSHDSAIISTLQKLSIDHQVALVVIHHTKKKEAEDFVAEVSGTFGLTGAADCVAVLSRKGRGQMDGSLKLTGRDIEEQELALKFDPNLGLWELLGEASQYAKSQERQDILMVLRENGPLTPKEVAEILGKNPEAIRQLLWKMKRDGEVKQIEGGKYTALNI